MDVILHLELLDWIIFALAVGAHIPLIFGLFYSKEDKSQTFFTWFLYCILDTITMFSGIKVDGNYILLFGFATGSLVMALILLHQRRIHWTVHETLIGLLIFICIYLWRIGGPYYSLIAGICAESIVGIYLIQRTFRYPKREYNLWGYILFLTTSVLSLFRAENLSIEQIGYPLCETILCSIILIPLLRSK